MPTYTVTRTLEEVVTISANNFEDAQHEIDSGRYFDWECVDISASTCIESSEDC
jgi:hypothetical protein